MIFCVSLNVCSAMPSLMGDGAYRIIIIYEREYDRMENLKTNNRIKTREFYVRKRKKEREEERKRKLIIDYIVLLYCLIVYNTEVLIYRV